jgi:anti-sigma factor RsiW
MPARGTSGALPLGTTDRRLWQFSQEIAASPPETERLLALAGFVDGRLDDDERERVAALLAGDPLAAADAAAARVLLSATMPAASDAIVARATALADPARSGGEILAFPQRQPRPQPQPQPRAWPAAARWTSLAAAIAGACWLGFDLGSGLPGLASITHPSDELGASELIDPAPLGLRDVSEGSPI